MPDSDRPSAHLSDSDPRRGLRLAMRRAELLGLPPPRHFSKQGAKLSSMRTDSRLPPDPWREYRFALRRAAERQKSGHDLVPIAQAGFTSRNSLGGSSNYRGAPPSLAVHVERDLARATGAHTVALILGVVWDFAQQAWRAKIKHRGKTWVRPARERVPTHATQYLGTYSLESDAALAYDVASCFIMGPMAVVNFPNINYDVAELPRPPPPWLVEQLLKAR